MIRTMFVNEEIFDLVNKAIDDFYSLNRPIKLKWKKVDKGYSNDNFFVTANEKTLAVVKQYKEDPILPAKRKLSNELTALKLYSKVNLAPAIIWFSVDYNILCYSFIAGNDLCEKEEIGLIDNKNDIRVINNAFSVIHNFNVDKEEKKHPNYVIEFYRSIFESYKKQGLVDMHLNKKIDDLLKSLTDLLPSYAQNIGYIHGDPVPTNIISDNSHICFIDFEYFRVDLPIFDLIYFNYYSTKHRLALHIDLTEEDNFYRDIIWLYYDLINILNKLWWEKYHISKRI